MSESPQSSAPTGEQGPDRRGRLEQGLSAVLDRVLEEFRQQAGDKFRQSDELAQLIAEIEARDKVQLAEPSGPGLPGLLAAITKINGQSEQSTILGTLVDGARQYSGRAAFFLNHPDGMVGWGGGALAAATNDSLDWPSRMAVAVLGPSLVPAAGCCG